MMNQKLIIQGVLCFMLTIQVFGQSSVNRYEVNGSIEGLQKDTIVYLVLNESGDTLAKGATKKGEFLFKGKLNTSIEWASVRIKGEETWPTFFLERKVIGITGSASNWKDATIVGSEQTTAKKSVASKIVLLENEYKDYGNKLDLALQKNDRVQIQICQEKRNKALDSCIKIKEDFISIHPNYAYSAWIIQKSPEFDLLKKEQAYNNLTAAVKESSFGKRLSLYISELKLKNTIVPGAVSPDFKLQTLDGKLISLADVVSKHKLTLLDFWASWCQPCRELTPELKKMQMDFRNKGFTILSISSDKSKNAWKQAIIKDSMDWLHVIPVNDKINPSQVFDVVVIPAFVLLDNKGHILAVDNTMSSISPFGFEKTRDTDAIYKKIEKLLADKN